MTGHTLHWVAMAVAAALVAGCGDKPQQNGDNSQTVLIGQASPLTGPQAHLGKDNENGARLADIRHGARRADGAQRPSVVEPFHADPERTDDEPAAEVALDDVVLVAGVVRVPPVIEEVLPLDDAAAYRAVHFYHLGNSNLPIPPASAQLQRDDQLHRIPQILCQPE